MKVMGSVAKDPTRVMTVFHIFKKLEERLLNKEMGDIKDSLQISRDESYNIFDEEYITGKTVPERHSNKNYPK